MTSTSDKKTQYEIYVDRQDPEPRQRTRHVKVETAGEQLTFADYQRAIDELGIDTESASISSGYILWTDTETEQEVQQRIQHAIDDSQRHLAAIKKMHEMYEKYVEMGLYDD